MIYLYAKIGELSEEQLDVLVDNLEEEWTDDRDYYLNKSMIDMLQAKGADSALLAMLRGALGTREDVDILWVDTEEDYEDDEDGGSGPEAPASGAGPSPSPECPSGLARPPGWDGEGCPKGRVSPEFEFEGATRTEGPLRGLRRTPRPVELIPWVPGGHFRALGHVHTHSVLGTDPAMVVYPGNTQGRNPREDGPRVRLVFDQQDQPRVGSWRGAFGSFGHHGFRPRLSGCGL